MLHISNDCKDIISDSDSHHKIIKFFEGLEKYGITFSQNQRNLLVTSTNSLVLGRSGTGKTTISAFKILALDLLFIAYKKKFFYKEDVQRLESCDFDNYTGCYTVFCTASPVLTNEVKRFYNDLLQSIKNVLKTKEEKAKHRKEETKEEPNQPQENMFDPFEGNIETQEETKDLKDAFLSSLEKAKEDLIEDIDIEKQLFHYNKLDHIPKNEFPLFLTVKKLVYMLDGNCSYSFFARDQKGKIIGIGNLSVGKGRASGIVLSSVMSARWERIGGVGVEGWNKGFWGDCERGWICFREAKRFALLVWRFSSHNERKVS